MLNAMVRILRAAPAALYPEINCKINILKINIISFAIYITLI
jgi:hypothetical protein